MFFNDLSHISPDILAEAVLRLEYIDLCRKELTPDQVKTTFSKLANCENLPMKVLDISENDLSSVPTNVLVKAISRLETVTLDSTRLIPTQINGIFSLVAERTSLKLRKVDLRSNEVRSVPEELRERCMMNFYTDLRLH